jgi:hypothetical protein
MPISTMDQFDTVRIKVRRRAEQADLTDALFQTADLRLAKLYPNATIAHRHTLIPAYVQAMVAMESAWMVESSLERINDSLAEIRTALNGLYRD